MPSYTITEPHPTVPQNSYTKSGRGGAGNFFRAPATTSPAGVPTPVSSSASVTSSARRFYSGRGGAGNAQQSADRPVLSFDEEFDRADNRDKTTVGHVGRGGAGNVFFASADSNTLERKSTSSSRRDSSSTSGSKSGFWSRLSNVGH